MTSRDRTDTLRMILQDLGYEFSALLPNLSSEQAAFVAHALTYISRAVQEVGAMPTMPPDQTEQLTRELEQARQQLQTLPSPRDRAEAVTKHVKGVLAAIGTARAAG